MTAIPSTAAVAPQAPRRPPLANTALETDDSGAWPAALGSAEAEGRKVAAAVTVTVKREGREVVVRLSIKTSFGQQ
jgi:hypothetical protein